MDNNKAILKSKSPYSATITRLTATYKAVETTSEMMIARGKLC